MTLTLSGGQSQRVGGRTKNKKPKKKKAEQKTNKTEHAAAAASCQKLLQRALTLQKGGSHFDLDPTTSAEARRGASIVPELLPQSAASTSMAANGGSHMQSGWASRNGQRHWTLDTGT